KAAYHKTVVKKIPIIFLAVVILSMLTAATSNAATVTKVAAGYYHSLFLKSDGSLWGMGYNGNGQLGDGTNIGTNRPEQILATNVTTIAGGLYYSLFLKNGGSLW